MTNPGSLEALKDLRVVFLTATCRLHHSHPCSSAFKALIGLAKKSEGHQSHYKHHVETRIVEYLNSRQPTADRNSSQWAQHQAYLNQTSEMLPSYLRSNSMHSWSHPTSLGSNFTLVVEYAWGVLFMSCVFGSFLRLSHTVVHRKEVESAQK